MAYNLMKFVHRRITAISKLHSRAGLYEFLDTEFAAIPTGSRVLTIGGDGPVTDRLQGYARSKGFKVLTADIDPNRQPDLIADFCDKQCLPKHKFDYLVLAEVLEHFHDPFAAVGNCRRLLGDGGVLILTTPFIFPIHERPVDHFRYTKFGLAGLLKEFDHVTIRERNTWLESCLVLPERIFFEKRASTRLFGALFIVLNIVGIPLARWFSRCCQTDILTTGYNVRAELLPSAP